MAFPLTGTPRTGDVRVAQTASVAVEPDATRTAATPVVYQRASPVRFADPIAPVVRFAATIARFFIPYPFPRSGATKTVEPVLPLRFTATRTRGFFNTYQRTGTVRFHNPVQPVLFDFAGVTQTMKVDRITR